MSKTVFARFASLLLCFLLLPFPAAGPPTIKADDDPPVGPTHPVIIAHAVSAEKFGGYVFGFQSLDEGAHGDNIAELFYGLSITYWCLSEEGVNRYHASFDEFPCYGGGGYGTPYTIPLDIYDDAGNVVAEGLVMTYVGSSIFYFVTYSHGGVISANLRGDYVHVEHPYVPDPDEPTAEPLPDVCEWHWYYLDYQKYIVPGYEYLFPDW